MHSYWPTVLICLMTAPPFAVEEQSVDNSTAKESGRVTDQLQAAPTPKIELRWLECTPLEKLTEEKGIPGSCDPNDVLYVHRKPALVLTAAEVAEARITEHDLRKNGLGILYSVTLVLTQDARDRLAANCPGKSARIMVRVDGMHWGWSHYTTDNDAQVSESCKAKNFNASMGFISSKSKAESIVNALKAEDRN